MQREANDVGFEETTSDDEMYEIRVVHVGGMPPLEK